jgi:hypothetical protein
MKLYGNFKPVKRLRFSEEILEEHRAYYSGYSFQKFVEYCIKNEINRRKKKRMKYF